MLLKLFYQAHKWGFLFISFREILTGIIIFFLGSEEGSMLQYKSNIIVDINLIDDFLS